MRTSSIDNAYKCFGCLHVRTGTIMLGVMKVVAYSTALVVLAISLFHPNMFHNNETNKIMKCLCDVHDQKSHPWSFLNHHFEAKKQPHIVQTESTFSIEIVNNNVVERRLKTSNHVITPKETDHDKKDYKTNLIDHLPPQLLERQRRQRIYWRFFMTTFYLAFSLLLLHGAVTKSPSNLLPYFCLQVFDFVITLLWVIGHLANVNSSRLLIEELKCVPWARGIAVHSPTVLAVLMISLCLLVLSVEAYLMGVVWACYKFLVTLRLSQHGAGGMAAFDLGTNLLTSFFMRLHNNSTASGGRSGRRGGRRDSLSVPLENGTTAAVTSGDEAAVTYDELPQYDETVKTPASKFMPPPYLGQDDQKCKEKSDKADEAGNGA